MGNGALPNGPSYRAYPRLYQCGIPAMSALSPLLGENDVNGKSPEMWRGGCRPNILSVVRLFRLAVP